MNKKQFDTKVRSLKRRGGTWSRDFDSIVKVAATLYYGECNHNIQCINDVMEAGSRVKGVNMSKLAAYYKKIIPHEYDSKLKQFGKKDKALAPQYESTWQGFLLEHPLWHEYSAPKQIKAIDPVSMADNFKKKLTTALSDGTLSQEQVLSILENVARFKMPSTLSDTVKPVTKANEPTINL